LPDLSPEGRAEALAEEPPPTGSDAWDAFLGGLAEHFATRWQLPVPVGRSGLLASCSGCGGCRRHRVCERSRWATPRRRGLFIGATTLERA
jgi:hypothetical protein